MITKFYQPGFFGSDDAFGGSPRKISCRRVFRTYQQAYDSIPQWLQRLEREDAEKPPIWKPDYSKVTKAHIFVIELELEEDDEG